MSELLNILGRTLSENSLGAILLAAFFTLLGIFIRGLLVSHKDISVAKINANVSLGEQAIQVMVAAMEALRDENTNLKNTISQMESHMDQIIELLIVMVQAKNQSDADKTIRRLEQFLKAIGKWPY